MRQAEPSRLRLRRRGEHYERLDCHGNHRARIAAGNAVPRFGVADVVFGIDPASGPSILRNSIGDDEVRGSASPQRHRYRRWGGNRVPRGGIDRHHDELSGAVAAVSEQ